MFDAFGMQNRSRQRLYAKATRCNVVKMLNLLTACPRTSSDSSRYPNLPNHPKVDSTSSFNYDLNQFMNNNSVDWRQRSLYGQGTVKREVIFKNYHQFISITSDGFPIYLRRETVSVIYSAFLDDRSLSARWNLFQAGSLNFNNAGSR